MTFKRRTHTCGELREEHIGEEVVLNGWAAARRDLGGVIFIELRDRRGRTQVVFEPTFNAEAHKNGGDIRSEYVLSIEGKVRKRPEGTENPELPTGMIDVLVTRVVVLNESETPPFPIEERVEAHEDLRLKRRYLDLRREPMRRNLETLHRMKRVIHEYMDENGFLEVETPILMKSTPEGARDFLSPSRLHPGKFYALPQSPQTYKQILMVAGVDRYYQIVKCFRDEDFRADRQPEFTQLDVEMSFVTQDDVMTTVEELMARLFEKVWGKPLATPIPRLSYEEAMSRYGSDKPDLRFGLEMTTLDDVFKNAEFRVFKEAIAKGGVVTGLLAPGCGDYTRNQLDVLTDFVKKLGAGGLIWVRVTEEGLEAPTMKFFADEEKRALTEALGAKPGDLLLILSGDRYPTLTIMGALRKEMARRLELIKPDADPKLLWVYDFPLLEWDAQTQRHYAMHHPFTSPREEDLDLLERDPGKARAQAYDLVLNGNEIAGGSIRIHDATLQKQMFKALGIGEEEAREKFGFLLDAFKYGAPPHGGVAFGFDRMAMIFTGSSSIRDVIPFPKTAAGVSLMDDAPSEVDPKQLRELHIRLRREAKDEK
jgi:aspartyl-tRNA synthetase